MMRWRDPGTRPWLLAICGVAGLCLIGFGAHLFIQRRYRPIGVGHYFADAELVQWLFLGAVVLLIGALLAWVLARHRPK